MSRAIAVTGKGGTGKTTVSALIIKHLKEHGEGPVLALDADPDANLATVLGVPVMSTIGDVREETLKAMKDFPAGMSKQSYIEAGLHEVITESDQVDLIAGYRAPRRDPFLRVFYGKGWSALCTLMFGYTVRDVDCGFKLFRREIIEELAPQIESRGATFSIEWLVRAKRAGYRFVELPVSHRPRVAGSQTGANIDVIVRAFRELIKFRLQLWREGKPGPR